MPINLSTIDFEKLLAHLKEWSNGSMLSVKSHTLNYLNINPTDINNPILDPIIDVIRKLDPSIVERWVIEQS